MAANLHIAPSERSLRATEYDVLVAEVKALRTIMADLDVAYSNFIDTDVLDPLAEAVGRMRAALVDGAS